MIQIELDCIPIPWSSPKFGKHGAFDTKFKEKEFIKWQIKSQYRNDPICSSVSLEFFFNIPVPKKTSRARQKQMLEDRIHPSRPDTTNMQKLYEDCLQDIIIVNDSSVKKVTSVKRYSTKPGVVILVRTWEEECERQYKTARAIEIEKQYWIKV